MILIHVVGDRCGSSFISCATQRRPG